MCIFLITGDRGRELEFVEYQTSSFPTFTKWFYNLLSKSTFCQQPRLFASSNWGNQSQETVTRYIKLHYISTVSFSAQFQDSSHEDETQICPPTPHPHRLMSVLSFGLLSTHLTLCTLFNLMTHLI